MLGKILALVDGQSEYTNIWEIRSIRFDVDADEERKPFERFILTSYNIEDAKGNPGSRGNLFITNLRLIWQLASDHFINLSVGWDTVTSGTIKTLPVGSGNSFKHLMLLKTQNMSQSRYEFKFQGYTNDDLNLFQKILEFQKKIVESKYFRCINLAVKCDPEFIMLQEEEVKSSYEECLFYEDETLIKAKIVLTDIRIIILKQGEKKMNYSIPWLMVRSIEKVQQELKLMARIHCRGVLAQKQLVINIKKGSQIKKLYLQLKSFSETANKSPILGFKLEKKGQQIEDSPVSPKINREIEQLEQTRVKLRRNKNVYDSKEGFGQLQETSFNQELGLMIEKLPEGATRADLWEILKN